MTDIEQLKTEVNNQLASADTLNTLIATTFKGLSPQSVKRAVLEGTMRGFTFENFLQKDVYAVPFGDSYSLVTSIDYARKIGMRSGIVGKSAPTFVESENGIVSCTVTVKRKVNEYVGDYTATVYFSEYTTGRQLWKTKPHTMIAKVAEMHALRAACPEELSQAYVEEEYTQPVADVIDMTPYELELSTTNNLQELQKAWVALPAEAKVKLAGLKDELKLQHQAMLEELQAKPKKKKKAIEVVPVNKDNAAAQEEFIKTQGIESIPF